MEYDVHRFWFHANGTLAAVSTHENQYSGIPDQETFDDLTNDFACPVWSTLDEEDGAALPIEFEG